MGSLRLTSAPGLASEGLLDDQRLQNHSSASLTLSCDDGTIPVHPQLISTAAPTIRKFLSQQDPSEPCFIHLDGYSLDTVTQLVELLYTGKTIVGNQISQQQALYTLMISLAITTDRIECRKIPEGPPPPTNNLLRTYPISSLKKDDNKENKTQSNQRPNTRSGVGKKLGRRPSDKFWVEETKCFNCLEDFDSENDLVKHLNSSCKSNLKDKWNYNKRSCFCGQTLFSNISTLLAHVEECVRYDESDNGESSDNRPSRRGHKARKQNAALTPTSNKRQRVRPSKKKRLIEDFNKVLEAIKTENNVEDNINESSEESSQKSTTSVEVKKEVQLLTVDPDLVRNQLGIVNNSDIAALACDKLSTLFYICPVCAKQHHRVTNLTTCLKQHGLRYCWVCLKLFPHQGFAFDAHCMIEHCERDEDGEFTSNKVNCPLCQKKFDYKQHLPSHMGSVHSHQLTYGDVDKSVKKKSKQGINEEEEKEEEKISKEEPFIKIEQGEEDILMEDKDVEEGNLIKEEKQQEETIEEKTTPTSLFPLEFAGGEWKFVREQVMDGQAYGFYINSANKVMGVPASKAKDL